MTMNEIQKLSRFRLAESNANANGIELLINSNEIVIQVIGGHTIFNAKSTDECIGFIYGYLENKR